MLVRNKYLFKNSANQTLIKNRCFKIKDFIKLHSSFENFTVFRLCAAHPTLCLSISILTIVFLSYPALSKLSLPISSPMDVYWSQSIDESEASSVPDWLKHQSPAFLIQQIIVKGSVEPWFGNLSAVAAVRASISKSFDILKVTTFYNICFKNFRF